MRLTEVRSCSEQGCRGRAEGVQRACRGVRRWGGGAVGGGEVWGGGEVRRWGGAWRRTEGRRTERRGAFSPSATDTRRIF